MIGTRREQTGMGEVGRGIVEWDELLCAEELIKKNTSTNFHILMF